MRPIAGVLDGRVRGRHVESECLLWYVLFCFVLFRLQEEGTFTCVP